MKQQTSSSASGGLQAVQDQFDCLVRSLVMSTFALNLKRSAEAQPVDGGGGGGNGEGGGRGTKEGRAGTGGRRSESGRKDAYSACKKFCDRDEPLLRRVGWSWCCGLMCRPQGSACMCQKEESCAWLQVLIVRFCTQKGV